MNNCQRIIVALFGESSSGKDTIMNYYINYYPNTKGIITSTTRPKRDYEVDDVDYHFLSVNRFTEKVLNGTMIEATSFREWFYGTTLEEIDENKINIGVFNIKAINCLLQDGRFKVIPIYVAAAPKTRLKRSLNREENPDCSEICRRFLADEKDFNEIDFKYNILYNNAKEGLDIVEINRVWANVINA